MTRTHSTLALATLAALGLAAATPEQARAQASIGVNFEGGGGSGPAVAVTDTSGAGAVVKTHYFNNEAGTVGTDALSDSADTPTGAALTYNTQATYGSYYPTNTPDTADYQLMAGYLDETSSAGTTITVTHVPYSQYDVYVYMSTPITDARTGTYTVNGVSQDDTTGGTAGDMAAPFDGTYYNGATNTFGNYLEFTGVTGDLSLTATSGFRAPVAGFQIVDASPAPEPSQTAALGLGVLGLAGLALRARKRTA